MIVWKGEVCVGEWWLGGGYLGIFGSTKEALDLGWWCSDLRVLSTYLEIRGQKRWVQQEEGSLG
jgi:hypothetical protein